MIDRSTILDLLNKFSNDNEAFSWKMKCTYSDGMGTAVNQIDIIAKSDNRCVGVFTFNITTGKVMICSYRDLKKARSGNIIDVLLDLINYSKGQAIG